MSHRELYCTGKNKRYESAVGAYHFRRVSDTPSREERCPKKLYSGRPRRHALHPFDGGISHSFDEHTHVCDVSVSDELPSDELTTKDKRKLGTWEGGSWDKSKRARGCPPARRPAAGAYCSVTSALTVNLCMGLVGHSNVAPVTAHLSSIPHTCLAFCAISPGRLPVVRHPRAASLSHPARPVRPRAAHPPPREGVGHDLCEKYYSRHANLHIVCRPSASFRG